MTTGLSSLYERWESCTACELGDRRRSLNADMGRGGGALRGVMFVCESVTAFDEAAGQALSVTSPYGALWSEVLDKLNFHAVYKTSLVSCRSSAPWLDPATGAQRRDFRTQLPLWSDTPPSKTQVAACLPRLHEEIYLVDPLYIVALGTTVAEALLGDSCPMTKMRGANVPIQIPGRTHRAVLTDKKRVWGRKQHGTMYYPTEQNTVEYIMIPTYDPGYIIRRGEDYSKDAPLRVFAEDIKKVLSMYEKYMVEAMGVYPDQYTPVDDELEDEHG